MPTYISMVNLTEQGVKEAKNAPERLQAFDAALKEAGGKLVGFYLVMGQFDYIVITEAPDDQTAARLILGTIAQGSMRTQTMRASELRSSRPQRLPVKAIRSFSSPSAATSNRWPFNTNSSSSRAHMGQSDQVRAAPRRRKV